MLNNFTVAPSQLDRMAAYNAKVGQKAELLKALRKRVTTTMIGALADFERAFGPLWGTGIPVNELTPAQSEARAAYVLLRTAVLDRGNEQARCIETDLTTFLKFEGN